MILAAPTASFASATALQAPPAPHIAGSAPASGPASPQSVKLRKAAGEFESMLLESLWKSAKDTFTDGSDQDADPITDTFNDFGMHSMALSVGQAGGLGIKNMIIKSLEPKVEAPPLSKRST
jgi:Rod binding domain-containing protein